jgi:hypothetical protein
VAGAWCYNDVSGELSWCELRECCSAIGVNHSLGRQRWRNGTHELKYASRLTHDGISWPHSICKQKCKAEDVWWNNELYWCTHTACNFLARVKMISWEVVSNRAQCNKDHTMLLKAHTCRHELIQSHMMMMMMGWDYVSELQPPACLLFIPQVIY